MAIIGSHQNAQSRRSCLLTKVRLASAMKRISALIVILLFASIFVFKSQITSSEPLIQTQYKPLPISAQISEVSIKPIPYGEFLETVKQTRTTFPDAPSAQDALFNWVDKDMFQYWDPTKWDFNGISRVPGEGEIACGYFVTTILQDLGFDIDRVRLAQAASGVMIEELTQDIKTTRSLDAMLEYVKSQPEGSVFIIGLDFHTGFITSAPEGVFFLHSNYIAREGVVREPAISSEALHQSGFYMIGNLSTRREIIEAWRENLG